MAGRLEVMFELNIADARSQGAAAGRNFAQGFSDAFKNATASFKLLNPQLFGNQQGTITPPTEAPGLRGILKSLAMGPLIPPNVIQGLKETTGKELGKVFAMGPLIPVEVIKGLRDQTGKDLAKVLSLPDITSFDKQSINWKQGIVGGLLGLRHPFVGARMMNEAGFFGGGAGGGKGGMLGGLLGGGGAGFEKAFVALEAVKIAAYGVKEAFEILKHSFEQGFKLFTESSRLGIKSGELFNREFAAKAIGVSVADIEKYMLRQQWGKARTSLQNFGAGSSIRNMNEMFQEMISSGQRLIPVMSRISGEFYRVGFSAIKLDREWDAMVSLIGEQLTGATQDFIESLTDLFQMMNDSGASSAIGVGLSAVIGLIEKIAVGIESVFATFAIGVETIGKTIAAMVIGVLELINKIPGVSRLAGHSLDNLQMGDAFQGTKEGAQKTADLWKRFFTKNPFGPTESMGQSGMPSAGGFKMPQMGAWEKMGYIIGAHRQESPVVHKLAEIHVTLKQMLNDNKKLMKSTLPGIQGGRYNPA